MGEWVKTDALALMGEFQALEGQWREAPRKADWRALRDLARRSARAVDALTGVTVAGLALDGQAPDLFYEKFFSFMAESGFDPYEPVAHENGVWVAPLDHRWLLEMENAGNESARRIRALCHRLANRKFQSWERFENPELRRSDERAWALFCQSAPEKARLKPSENAKASDRRSEDRPQKWWSAAPKARMRPGPVAESA